MRRILLLFSVFFSVMVYSQGHETFENFDRTGSSYGNGTFEGQDGSTWTYSECRGDIDLNDKAITLGRNRPNPIFVESGTINGGMGTLEFSYMQAFSSNVNLEVYVNDNIVYTATTDDEADVVKNTGPITVNVEGDIVLKFAKNNSSGQVTIDDVIWTAHSSNPNPNECSQSTASNDVEDGYGYLHMLIIASDFVVDQGEAFTLEQVKMNVIVETGFDVSNANLTFYEPSSDGPGGLITSQNALVPSAQSTVDDLGDYDVKEVTFDLPTPITFEATNSSDKVYWMGVNIEYDGVISFLEVSSLFDTPNGAYLSTDEGQTWDSAFDTYGDNFHGVIEFSGICEELDDNPIPPGGSCEWTVIVEEDYFGDEVFWELRTMDGVVLLSGGDYGNDYYDEQTVTAEGPLEFWITNDGFFGDNTPNYSVSNGTQVLVSGTMPNGGDTLTFSDLNCEGGPNPPGDDCEINFAMSLDNGIGNLQTLLLADDFIVASGTTMTVDRVTYRIFNNIGQATNITIFENNAGIPGNIVETFTNVAPESQTIVGNNFGFNAYDVVFDLPTPVELATGTYWLGLQVTAGSDGGTNYWVITDEGIGSAGHYSSDGGISWTQTTNLNDFSFKVEGQCEGGGDPVLTYCEPSLDCTDGDVITNVTFQEIDNDSGCSPNGYGDYTNLVATVQSGGTYPISVTVGDGWANESVSVWIDFDNNGTFDEDEFFYIGTGSDEPLVGNIEIPASVADGQHRMRVRVAAVGAGTATWDMACDSSQGYGETEDYTLIIGEIDSCTGTPEAGVTSVSPATGNVGTTYTVSNSGHDFADGMSYQWQSNTDGAGWVDEGNATDILSSYTATAPDDLDIEVEWRLAVTCTVSNETSYSDTATFTTVFQYCTPEGTNSSYYIDSFSTTGGAVNISNLNSGFSDNGYGDFYDAHTVVQVPGQDVSFLAEFPAGQTYGVRIWVDWDQNGDFDETEEVAWNSTSYLNPHSGTFTVPADALAGETRMRIVGHWLNSSADISPCETNHTYGEFEDYKFVVGQLDNCIGTPDPGVVSVNPEEGNVGTTYTVSATGYDYGNGYTYQWQSNTDGAGWVNEGDATDTYSSYTATAPDELDIEVEWRLEVTCTFSSESAISNVAVFTTIFQYCTPGGSDTWAWIDDFSTTGGVQNISNLNSGFSAGGYGDFYDTHSVEQVVGGEINFNMIFDPVETCGARIWVDWNQDGEFSEDEVVWNSTAYAASHTASFTVPATALQGETRMRIVNHWLSSTGDVDPCATNHGYGEFEDYKFIVSELTGCDGTPDGGVASVSPAVAAPGASYTVSASGYTIADGLTFQWESNTDGAGWVEEGASTDSYQNYTATAPDEMDIEVEWRLKVTCVAVNESAYSTTATFVTGIQYCEPAANCVDGDNIVNVTFREINNTTDCSPNGYGDYTHLTATVEAGETYDISVTVGDGWYERVSLWIDWNQDGVFDSSEYMGEIADGGQGDVLEDTITIPAEIAEGEYRMRFFLGAVGSGNPAPEDPCLNDPEYYGEAEDYTLIVDEAAGIDNNTHTGFTFYPNPAETTLYLKSDVKIESVSGYNVLGQKVISNNQFNNGQVDVSNLSTGAYLFEVIFENGTTETFRVLRK